MRTIDTYERFHRHLAAWMAREMLCLLLLGPPGTGKSFGYRAALGNRGYHVFGGRQSPLHVYMTLQDDPDRPVVLDDISSLLRDDLFRDLLKGLTDTGPRVVRWGTTTAKLQGRPTVPSVGTSALPSRSSRAADLSTGVQMSAQRCPRRTHERRPAARAMAELPTRTRRYRRATARRRGLTRWVVPALVLPRSEQPTSVIGASDSSRMGNRGVIANSIPAHNSGSTDLGGHAVAPAPPGFARRELKLPPVATLAVWSLIPNSRWDSNEPWYRKCGMLWARGRRGVAMCKGSAVNRPCVEVQQFRQPWLWVLLIMVEASVLGGADPADDAGAIVRRNAGRAGHRADHHAHNGASAAVAVPAAQDGDTR